jgi:hypothetical protein
MKEVLTGSKELDNLFEVDLQRCYQCPKCNHSSWRGELLNFLGLNMIEGSTLQKCLYNWVDNEASHEEKCPNESCKRLVQVKPIKSTFTQLPQILVICFQRVDMSNFVKNNTSVTISRDIVLPSSIDDMLTPYRLFACVVAHFFLTASRIQDQTENMGTISPTFMIPLDGPLFLTPEFKIPRKMKCWKFVARMVLCSFIKRRTT